MFCSFASAGKEKLTEHVFKYNHCSVVFLWLGKKPLTEHVINTMYAEQCSVVLLQI